MGRVRSHGTVLMTRKIAQRWYDINEAPVGIGGHVWCKEVGDRADAQGQVIEYELEGGPHRTISSDWKGFKFTHWHPFPRVPVLGAD